MPTYSEIIEELFALIEGGAMLDEEIDTLNRLENEYYILKSMEKSE